MRKPNILFIFSDQHNPMLAGYAGNSVIRTPRLDALAAEGVNFANMYCGSPLCVPSRMALLSGLLPNATGVHTNFDSLPSEQPTFVHSLASAGYRTVLAGRMHFNGPDQRHGFQERLVGDITPVRFDQGAGVDLGPLTGSTDQSRVSVEKSGAGNTSVIDYDRDVTEAVIECLRDHDGREPLFLTAGFYGPHCPFVCPRDLFDYYYEKVSLPQYPESFKEEVHPFIKQWYENRGITTLPEEDIRRAVAAYYGLIELMDGHIGRILDALKDNPCLEDTVVVYTSDHGDMAGDKGLFWKSSFYEGSVRVPCVLSHPGVLKGGRTISQPTSLLDLGPTWIDMAGGLPLPRSDGESLLPLLREEEAENPERCVVSLLGDLKGDVPGAMIRRGPWKMAVYHGYEHPQLFNLEEDPEEFNDLGQDASHARLRKELQEALAPSWDGSKTLAEVETTRENVKYWAEWRKSAEVEASSEIYWKTRAHRNYLESADKRE